MKFIMIVLVTPVSNFPLFSANLKSLSSIRFHKQGTCRIYKDCVKVFHKVWHEVSTMSIKMKSFVVNPKQGDPATAGEEQRGNMTPFGANS